MPSENNLDPTAAATGLYGAGQGLLKGLLRFMTGVLAAAAVIVAAVISTSQAGNSGAIRPEEIERLVALHMWQYAHAELLAIMAQLLIFGTFAAIALHLVRALLRPGRFGRNLTVMIVAAGLAIWVAVLGHRAASVAVCAGAVQTEGTGRILAARQDRTAGAAEIRQAGVLGEVSRGWVRSCAPSVERWNAYVRALPGPKFAVQFSIDWP